MQQKLPDLPPEALAGIPGGTQRVARADGSLAHRMFRDGEPTPTSNSGPTRTGSTPEPLALSGPRSFHTADETSVKRQHNELTPGMRMRLIDMIARARAAFAEAHAAGDRRAELQKDLMTARNHLRAAQDDEARRGWLARRQGLDPALLQEIAERRRRVDGLQAALTRVTEQQDAASQRGCALRLQCGLIGGRLSIGKRQVVVYGFDPAAVDLARLEEKLHEQA